MIVFGDACFEAPLGQLVSNFCGRAARARRSTPSDLQVLRTLLIEAGQIEQAIADEQTVDSWQELARVSRGAIAATDGCARLFLSGLRLHELEPAWCNAEQLVEGLRAASLHERAAAGRSLRVKSPEGFAFYNLFPEQYANAAGEWACAHAASIRGKVLIVGVRSIGTSLSAIVAAAVHEAGWNVSRMTVRPSGEPSNRQAEIPTETVRGCSRAVVVDEGPGLSGSSMACVARALVEAGMSRDRIAFFPGSLNEPGPVSTAEIRGWWRDVPRFWSPLNGASAMGDEILDQLSRKASALAGSSGQVKTSSIGGGLWRTFAFKRKADWPGVVRLLERDKYLSLTRGREPFIWRFAGLSIGSDGASGAEGELERLGRLASAGFTSRPLGVLNGYVAMPWIAGSRLQRRSRDTRHIHRLGEYLLESSEPPLSRAETRSGLARLQHMLYWNTLEALGRAAAECVRHWSDEVCECLSHDELAAYSDGRLAPHEWIEAPDGVLFKTDAGGHCHDHTVVGRQLLAWDIAGAAVEWDLSNAELRSLIAVIRDGRRQDGGDVAPSCQPGVIVFHAAAYCALRVGICSLGIEAMGGDTEEVTRLRRDRGYYSKHLVHVLRLHRRLFQDDAARAVDAEHPRAA